MKRRDLAFIFGTVSAAFSAGLAAYVGIADPALDTTVLVLSIATPINAAIAGAAGYLQAPGD